jgi:surfactin synthase thioesterase subunit/glycosyltransferase involved in cell wall biosynthesis
MRILLAHNSLYYPSHGGGDKSNRLLMEALAARGHEVRVVARIAKFGPEEHRRLLQQLQARGVQPEVTLDAVRFPLNGVDVHTLTLNTQLRAYFSEQLTAFDPDVIVTSTDDPGQLLFDVARRYQHARLVYLVRATIAVPFGPDSSIASRERTDMLRHADAIVGVSEYVAGYVRRWSGLDAIHLPISLMEPVEAPNSGRFDNSYVVMVNPCAVKGIAIFVAVAARLPHIQFGAVPMWGTNAADLAALRKLPNITLLDPVDNIDDLLRQTRVALVPSVWAEARSRIVVEAMLRGVPVIASDAGGLKEAKLGVPYLLPVNLITHYQPTLDENLVPVAEVPAQDIAPWEAALRRLTSDQAHWEEIAAQSRTAALEYTATLTAEPFETFLLELLKRPKKSIAERPPRLSEDKRKLIALRMRQNTAKKQSGASPWFPTLEEGQRGTFRLFCFPHAGGGTIAYRNWSGSLAEVSVTPVLLPGRETRASEPPFEDMRQLIDALISAIQRLVEAPYAFFGHSMGAGIAFELARSLRRIGAPQPRVLIVSGARAPQLRLGQQRGREPSDDELIQELRRLEGVPGEVLTNREALQLALPLLRADTRLYRNYEYRVEPPLAVPIRAYGGASDPNVRPEHLDGWAEQTTRSFIRREFAGGHFYLDTNESAVLEAVRGDLER